MSSPADRRRLQIRNALLAQFKAGRPIVGGGAGIGLSAKFIEQGGGDLIIIYNSGRFRMQGRGSLAGLMPYGNANDVVVDMAKEVLPIVHHTPVLAGVCATDPYRIMSQFLSEISRLGFAGVQNFPTVGLIDGQFRQNLEETGMGYGEEIKMIRTARSLGLLTAPYVFDPQQAEAMANAGADIVVAHMGLTTSGSIGAKSGKTLEDCVGEVQAIADAVARCRNDVFVLCHGGPIASPDDAAFILKRCRGVHGFFGASSMERLPVETAIKDTTRQFKEVECSSTAFEFRGHGRPLS